MASLTDLFNSTFFMFLGILVLVVALLVVYFESKFREQNHKISSMLSLVSSLAEEVNGTKMIIHQLTMNPQMQQPQQFFQSKEPVLERKIMQNNDNLIPVSDDEDSDDEDSDNDNESYVDSDDESASDNDDAASEVSIDESVDEDSNAHEEPIQDIKVFRLNINEDSESEEEAKSIASLEDLDEMEDLGEMEDLDDSSSTSSDSIKATETTDVKKIDNFMDLKSINITLEETKTEQSIDYKKMALPKLRSVVAEKGLSSDSSKLKKNELLKLLGVE
jgi:hypothetical protein